MDSSSNRSFFVRPLGHFVRVLVDIDLLGELRDKFLIEGEGFAFFLDIEYEKISDFCSFSKFLGHNEQNCRRKQNTEKNINLKKVESTKVPINNKSPSRENERVES